MSGDVSSWINAGQVESQWLAGWCCCIAAMQLEFEVRSGAWILQVRVSFGLRQLKPGTLGSLMTSRSH